MPWLARKPRRLPPIPPGPGRPPLLHGHSNSINGTPPPTSQFGELLRSDGSPPGAAPLPHYRRILEIDPEHAQSHRAPSPPSKMKPPPPKPNPESPSSPECCTANSTLSREYNPDTKHHPIHLARGIALSLSKKRNVRATQWARAAAKNAGLLQFGPTFSQSLYAGYLCIVRDPMATNVEFSHGQSLGQAQKQRGSCRFPLVNRALFHPVIAQTI